MVARGFSFARTRAAPLVIILGSLVSCVLGQAVHTQLIRPEMAPQASHHPVAGITGTLGPAIARVARPAKTSGPPQHPAHANTGDHQGHGKDKGDGKQGKHGGGGEDGGHGDHGGD